MSKIEMTDNDGKLICDKEIGHYTRGWHSCKRGATVSVPSKRDASLILHYCPRHSGSRNTNVGQCK